MFLQLMKKIFLSLVLLLTMTGTYACLNLESTSFKGKKVLLAPDITMYFHTWLRFDIEREKQSAEIRAAQMLEENRGKWTSQNLSNYSVWLIKAGKVKEAKKVLDTLIVNYPDNYSINANYGTLMELLGENKKALLYTQKAIAIDRTSHDGSEWIHVKILEAKIKNETDASWFKQTNLLGYNFGTGTIPDTSIIKNVLRERAVLKQILYQLHERTYFIQPKDEIVADLFYTAACIFQCTYGNEYAMDLYIMSMDYGNKYKDLCLKRIEYIQKHYNVKRGKHLVRGLVFDENSSVAVIEKDTITKDSIQKEIANDGLSVPKKKTDNPVDKKDDKKNAAKKTLPLVIPPVLIVLIAVAARRRRLRRKQLEQARKSSNE